MPSKLTLDDLVTWHDHPGLWRVVWRRETPQRGYQQAPLVEYALVLHDALPGARLVWAEEATLHKGEAP